MTPEALAALHALCFTDAPRPWTAAEFAALGGDPAIVVSVAPGGFAVGRFAAPEAELLTLAVHPDTRRRGVGSQLVAMFEAAARAAGASEVYLEVATTNAAARALYERHGYVQVGRRPRYYVRAGAPPIDALVLTKPLGGGGGESD